MKLTPTQKKVLVFVGTAPHFPAQYAHKAGISTAAASRVLSSLEHNGLVKGDLMLAQQNFANGTACYSRAYSSTPKGREIVKLIDAEDDQ